MLHTILTQNALLRDAFIKILSLEQKSQTENHLFFYQHGAWVLAYTPNIDDEKIQTLFEEYGTFRIFIAETGRSIDVIREIGDVILPNVFLSYNPLIAMSTIDEKNRDALMGTAHFLDIFSEQKDYYVEDFGLSIGGIVVSGAPQDDSLSEKLMKVYEADIYTEKKNIIFDKDHSLGGDVISLFAVSQGKNPKQTLPENIYGMIVKNLIDTVQLFDEHQEKTSG